MSHKIITDTETLNTWCENHREVEWIALDTEFISENYYEPLLCLIQVASPRGDFLIDPILLGDTTPFWEVLVTGEHETIVHAGQSEMEFCFRYTKNLPRKLFDVQTAAGLAGYEYPAGFTNLLFRVLGRTIPGTESRTNWKARPLSPRQLDYALDDVIHLREMRDALFARLIEQGRRSWLTEEMETLREHHRQHFAVERWRRVLRNTALEPHGMAILRELWYWREEAAKKLNTLPRRLLRDDLMLEIAKRKLGDAKSLRDIRGMERELTRRAVPEIAKHVSLALTLAKEECPKSRQTNALSRLTVAGQLLYTALGSICKSRHLSINLMGTPMDVKEWIAWRLGFSGCEAPPLMARGWRAEVVGKIFDDLLSGRTLLRIGDPRKECPIEFVPQAEP